MELIIKYLNKKGYTIDKSYYEHINNWYNIWKGKAEWLEVETTNGKKYPMYSMQMAKRSCEDFASMLTSETYEVIPNSYKEMIESFMQKNTLLERLPLFLEKMAYSGTVCTVLRVKNAIIKDEKLVKNVNTKMSLITVAANQLIPLKIVDGKIVDVAIISVGKKIIDKKLKNVYYIEIHELKPRGYQITNIILNDEGKEIIDDAILPTYNTLSNIPLFSICKLNKENPIESNMGLGASIYANAIDQLQVIDLTYNNFGTDFKLGQKILIINKKLTKEEVVEEKQQDGTTKLVKKVSYPSDLQKNLYQEVDVNVMKNDSDKIYVHEYNPDLRVGDNKEGVQFALNTFSFSIGFGTKYYKIDADGKLTATEYVGDRQDMIANGVKNRKAVKEYIIGILKAYIVAEKILDENVNPITFEVEIPDVDGFLEDDNVKLERAKAEVAAGLMSKMTYLTKYRKLTEEEAKEEIAKINEEKQQLFGTFGE